MSGKIDRADKILVLLGHYESRAAAQAAISAGGVTVSGRVLTKASEKISSQAEISAKPAHPWVSRGGVKLAHALAEFKLEVAGIHCLDIGASTGGFSDVLLQRGAASIIAVDVGRGQLHPKIAGDRRVTSFEGMDARQLDEDYFPNPPDLIVCDASFISLSKLLQPALSLAARNAKLIALFKPQFEVGRAYIGKGGIVTDPQATHRAERAFIDWLAQQDWVVEAAIDSPIKGGDGNAERLILAGH